MTGFETFEVTIRPLDEERDVVNQSRAPVRTDRIKVTGTVYDKDGLMSNEIFGKRAFRCGCKAAVIDYVTRIYVCETCGTIVGRSSTGVTPKLIKCGCHLPRIKEREDSGFMCSKCNTELLSESVRDNVRSYIKLNRPILSPIFAGSGGAILARVLACKSAFMAKIVKAEILFDKVDLTFKAKANTELHDVDRYIYGAECLQEYVLKTFDFETETLDLLTRSLNKLTLPGRQHPLNSFGFFYKTGSLMSFTLPSGEKVYYNPLATRYIDPIKFSKFFKKYVKRFPKSAMTTTGLKYLFSASETGSQIFNPDVLKVLNPEVIKSILEELFHFMRSSSDESAIHYIADSLWTFSENSPIDPRQIFVTDILDNYDLFKGYVYVAPGDNSPATPPNLKMEQPEEIISTIIHTKIIHPMNRLCMLLNGDKRKLEGMIINVIRVTPPNTRPEINGRHASITKLYAEIIQANNMLEHIDKNSVEDLAYRINRLYEKCCNLLVKTTQTEKEIRKSILDTLGHKEGLIRNKMLGKRVDYSGRSVIVGDPTLKLNQCSLPFSMCKEIFEFHLRIRGVPLDNDTAVREALVNDILKKVPVALNRAPTLHRPSLSGFYVLISDDYSIGLPLIVCQPFNADFDGDAMAVHVPLSDAAIEEVKALMMVSVNVYAPASGKVMLLPSQEMLYGLNVLTRNILDNTLPSIEYASMEAVYHEIAAQKIHVNQPVVVGNYRGRAGYAAMRHCVPFELWGKIAEINNSNIEELISSLMLISIQKGIGSVNLLVHIGFACATLYAPPATVLGKTNITNAPLGNFYEDVKEYAEAYANGFLCDDHYNLFYQNEFNKVRAKVEANIIQEIGEDNGYSQMVLSGARGTRSSLTQIFAMKGMIKRDNTTTFNAIIPHGHLHQLNSLEHFISAFGARFSLQEKTQKTEDTGYESRRMAHASGAIHITNDDCETDCGIVLSREYMRNFVTDASQLDRHLIGILTGRCLRGTSHYLTSEEATRLVQTGQDSFEIRSSLTCDNPVCSKCYGADLLTLREANVGTPIGFIAAETIGEVGTQLTMRTFHGGGVASKGSITSAFDRMTGILHFSKRAPDNCPSYDPVAWATGQVITGPHPNGIVATIEGHKGQSPVLPKDAVLKEFVRKGEGMCKIQGDFDISDLMENNDMDTVLNYLLMSMYFTYTNHKDVNFKHFEVIIHSMVRYIVYDSNDAYFKIGQQMMTSDYIHLKPANVRAYRTLRGIDKATFGSIHGLTQLQFEDIGDALREVYYNDNDDKLVYPLNRALLGLPPKMGTWYPNYLSGRVQMLSQEAIV